MAFDWMLFLEGRGISYRTRGPNVSRGFVVISCPFCKDGDPVFHMSLNLERGSWKCWRNQNDHRGFRPHRLVQAVIHCSYEQAQEIVGDDGFSLGDSQNFLSTVEGMLSKEGRSSSKVKALDFLPEMKPVEDTGAGTWFLRYLVENRLYTKAEALELCQLYDLQYAISGKFAYRLVIPVFMDTGLANWTGRAISPTAAIRYRTLTTDEEKAKEDNLPPATHSIEETLWNYGELIDQGGDMLVLVEGPTDAIRVDYFGANYGIRATCLFGKNLSNAQVELLGNLSEVFTRKLVLLDVDARFDAIRLNSRLCHLGFRFEEVPFGIKDPAMMEPEDIRRLGEAKKR